MRAPPSGSPAKIPDFRRTCRLKFEPRRRRRRPTPCNSTLPTCWGRQRSAATKIVRLLRSAAAAPGVPGLAPARRASEKHQPAAHGRPLSRRAIRKAAAKGPARNQHARGPTGSAGQVTLAAACPWAGAATCKRVDTIQQVTWHESGPRRCECNNILPGRLSMQQGGTCSGTNEAATRPVSQTTTVAWCEGACAQITNKRSVRSG